MNHDQLLKKISELESLNDQLQAEFRYINGLLKKLGFEKGLHTLKEAAEELISQENDDQFG